MKKRLALEKDWRREMENKRDTIKQFHWWRFRFHKQIKKSLARNADEVASRVFLFLALIEID